MAKTHPTRRASNGASVAKLTPAGDNTQPGGYQPNRTLGRSGWIEPPADKLCTRIRHLDALLAALTSDGGDGAAIFGCNEFIQSAVLDLASDLAYEIHELYTQVTYGEEALNG